MNAQLWKAHLEWAEGRRPKPYVDSVGKLSIGVGRNLDDRGLRDTEINFLLDNDVAEVLAECAALPYWDSLNDARQIVIADMVFNLGLGRFLKFRKLAAALEAHDYDTAADEMKASKWYGQVKRRAVKLVAAMRSGRWTS
jgi:lysozyme